MLFEILNGSEMGFAEIITYVISCLVVIFITLPIHELAHGFVANKLGDPTARYQGRLTFNPLAHVDYIGAFSIIVFGFGWAKAVPVNMGNFKNPRRDMAITALAGPVSNLLMALVCNIIVCLFVYVIGFKSIVLYYIVMFFNYISQISVSLAVFNLIPIPPLDGSRIISAFLPPRIYYNLMRYERYFFMLLIVLMASDVLAVPLSYAIGSVDSALFWLASLPFRLIMG
ncbi:MAG: site-2 protease family protein [Clostridia bacterium]|nr:site-2 protease family protein [Clostridia bacterium]